MSPVGAATSEGSSGENISHFAAIRVRVNGIGNLKMTVYSLDDIKSKVLVPLVMQPKARIIPTRLVNFMEQRASFELKTTDFDEQFRINRIVIFTKETYTSYPGN
jgi:hypothetical protein